MCVYIYIYVSVYLRRFATRTTRTQGISREKKSRPTSAKQKKLGSNSAVLGLVGPNMEPAWAQLEQVGSNPN